MALSTAISITDAHKRRFQEDGYFILERAIPPEHLDLLRDECQRFIDEMHAEMDRQGTDVLGLNHRNKRYFVAHPSLRSPRLKEFLFSDLMADICRATIGDQAYLFWEQYVVKAAEQGMKFGWHQDSGFEVGVKHEPYVSCWCALEDMSEANGTISVLPYARAGTREVVEHVREQGTNDLIGYHGDDPGELVVVPAGSIAVFSSVAFHRSGPNTTDRMRRVYLAQYSPEVIPNKEGTAPYGRDEQLLKDGRRVV